MEFADLANSLLFAECKIDDFIKNIGQNILELLNFNCSKRYQGQNCELLKIKQIVSRKKIRRTPSKRNGRW